MIDQAIHDILVRTRVDIVLSVPCNMLGGLLKAVAAGPMRHIGVCREEEGVGVAAGAALAGKRPVLLMQNSGFGNSVNALLSLTSLYRLPLFLLMSHRGGPGESIVAQKPMGAAVPQLLDALHIPCMRVETPPGLEALEPFIVQTYQHNSIQAALLSRELWHEAH